MIEKAKSTTHLHLLSIANTEVQKRLASCGGRMVRLLDAGCGDGLLIDYLSGALTALNPDMTFEIYGFDVYDHGIQGPEYMSKTIEFLRTKDPSVPWLERLSVISVDDPWDYPDQFFDVVLTNQVLEHVRDLDLFFSEINRTPSSGGVSTQPRLHPEVRAVAKEVRFQVNSRHSR